MTYRGWLVIWVLIFIFFTVPFLKITAVRKKCNATLRITYAKLSH